MSAASASTAAAAPAGGIFGDAAKKKDDKPKEKRVMLKNVDTVAFKVLDPYGLSIVDDISLSGLWKQVAKGDKWANFFSELAATEENCKDPSIREAIGLSRYCETMENAIREWRGATSLRKMIKEKSLQRADEEANEMMKHFQRANLGKRAWKNEKNDSFASYKDTKRRKIREGVATASAAPTATAGPTLEQSVKAVVAFLEKGKASNLRMMMSYLSTGGVFFAAHTLDKTARAFLKHKTPTPTAESILKNMEARAADDGKADEEEDEEFEREEATGNLLDD